MTNKSSNQTQGVLIEQATVWYHRLQQEKMPEADAAKWQNWLAKSDEHKQAFEKVEEIMQLSCQVDQINWPTEDELTSDDYDIALPVAQWKTQRSFKQGACEEAGQSASKAARFNWRELAIFKRFTLPAFPAPAFAGLSVAFVAVLMLGVFFLRGSSSGDYLDVVLHETWAAEHRVITLSDGSQITLGAKSLISAAYSEEQRRVVLERGEAFFDVAKDPQRPFVVVSGDHTITAIGTAFNVARQSDRVVVTVAEGVVRVEEEPKLVADQTAGKGRQKDDVDSAAVLLAGQQITYGNEKISEVVVTDAEVVTAWRQGRLKYISEELRYVIADVNRYSNQSIHLADEKLGSTLFTGTVSKGKIDNWLDSLGEAFPIEIERKVNGDVILLSRYDDSSP